MPPPAACYSTIPEYGCDGTVFSLKYYAVPATENPEVFWRYPSMKPHPFKQEALPPKQNYNCEGYPNLSQLGPANALDCWHPCPGPISPGENVS
tara:strand:- start:15 stop:296 length:282 start_codon:yes stop_codon:yes gene_type:complete